MRAHALLLLALAACLEAPSYEGRLCDESAPCPAPYFCWANGTCHLAVEPDDAGAGDARPDADSADAGTVEAGEGDTGLVDSGAEPDATPADGGGPSPARCSDPPAFPATGWEARHFTLTAANALDSCAGVEDLAGPDIDRDYRGTGPLPTLTERFGTRYTATRTLAQGTYTFELSYDDGVRLFIDDTLIFEEWTAPNVVTGRRVLTPYLSAGQHRFTVEHFEGQGFAQIRARVSRGCGTLEAPLEEDRWTVGYYRESGGAPDLLDCFGTETLVSPVWYGPLDLAFGSTTPALVAQAQVSAGWVAVARGNRSMRGLTRFDLAHSGRARFTINSTLILDAPGSGSTTRDVYFSGLAEMELQLFHQPGDLGAELTWEGHCAQGFSLNDQTWAATYFRVRYDPAGPSWTLDGEDCLYAEILNGTHLTPDWPQAAPPFLVSTYGLTELWGGIFVGARDFGASTTASIQHDDGVVLHVDGTPLYSSWSAPQFTTAPVTLSGRRALVFYYFQNRGGAGLRFTW